MAGGGSPCGACKFLRRKCVKGCVFAPYFCSDQGAAYFGAVHKVFGASNVSKLLQQVPISERCEAVVSICYEAQARLQDPVYGCVAHIFALQHQVANLQAQLNSAQTQLASGLSVMASSGNPTRNVNGNHNSALSTTFPLEKFLYPTATASCTHPGAPSHENHSFYNYDSMDHETGSATFPMSIDYHQEDMSDKSLEQLDVNNGGELQALALAFLRRN